MIKTGFLEWMLLCLIFGVVITNYVNLKKIQIQTNEIICEALEMDNERD